MKKGLLLILAVVFAFSMNAQIFSDDFESGMMDSWITVTPTYDSFNTTWHLNNDIGNFVLRASCYDGSNHATEQWVISPSFSTLYANNLTIEFDNDQNYNPYQDLELFITTEYVYDSLSFYSATWHQISDLTLSDGDWNIVHNTSDISTYVGESSVSIAFKFVSTNDAGGVWDVDNIVVSDATDISKVSDNLKIFPNPAINDLNISSVSNINNITVSNVIGQTVLSFNDVNADHFTVNVADLTKGVYLINIENADGTSAITKFVKK